MKHNYEPSELLLLADMRCRVCGAGCLAEGAVFHLVGHNSRYPEPPDSVLAWCCTQHAGSQGLLPWSDMPATHPERKRRGRS